MPHSTENITHPYKSMYNLKRENQVILLIITDGKKWHYLPVKSFSALFCKISSSHKEDFYCLNCFHSYVQKINLKNIKVYAKIIIIAM